MYCVLAGAALTIYGLYRTYRRTVESRETPFIPFNELLVSAAFSIEQELRKEENQEKEIVIRVNNKGLVIRELLEDEQEFEGVTYLQTKWTSLSETITEDIEKHSHLRTSAVRYSPTLVVNTDLIAVLSVVLGQVLMFHWINDLMKS